MPHFLPVKLLPLIVAELRRVLKAINVPCNQLPVHATMFLEGNSTGETAVGLISGHFILFVKRLEYYPG
jgi:hypothetical protein